MSSEDPHTGFSAPSINDSSRSSVVSFEDRRDTPKVKKRLVSIGRANVATARSGFGLRDQSSVDDSDTVVKSKHGKKMLSLIHI